MTKLFVTLPALALVVALSGSALANNGAISNATLDEMGLSGIALMSDEQALAVRGLGWEGDHHFPELDRRHKKPWSMAFGISHAEVNNDQNENGNGHGGNGHGTALNDHNGHDGGFLGSASAGTLDGFLAVGRYSASGSHLSEAIITRTRTKVEDVPGVGKVTKTRIRSLGVASGGKASSMSF